MTENEMMITLSGEDGDVITLSVLEQTMLQGQRYLLACDAEEEDGSEDAMCYILKEIPDESEEKMVSYEFVEDDHLLDSLMKIFEELLEDVDLEVSF